MTTYNEIRPYLQTGDIVLFYGEGITSRIIRWGSALLKIRLDKPAPSHISTVVRTPYEILMLHSTSISKIPNFRTGKIESGPQMSLLSRYVREYNGRITVRHIRDRQITPEMMQILTQFRKSIDDKPYEKNPLEVMLSALGNFRFWFAEKADLTSIFCSELIAELWRRWSWLPFEFISNRAAPIDWAEGGQMERSVNMSPEREITA